MSKDEDAVLLELSAALDEVYRLRAALADEACVLEARRATADGPVARQVARMRAAARGERDSHSHLRISGGKAALRSAGADECLTRHQFAQELSADG